jgi:hypothetical protein
MEVPAGPVLSAYFYLRISASVIFQKDMRPRGLGEEILRSHKNVFYNSHGSISYKRIKLRNNKKNTKLEKAKKK